MVRPNAARASTNTGPYYSRWCAVLSSATATARDGQSHAIYRWYVVGLLTVAYIFSFVDRQILSLLVEPIKGSLLLSDTQMSLLQGFAFALFYSVLGIPIGRLADVSSRRRIIAAGVALWSLMTIMCGFAASFAGLFLARVGVGIGEAALSPPAYSLMHDYFGKNRLGVASSVYAAGGFVGAGLAMIVGGATMDVLASQLQHSALVGRYEPWQLIFMLVGAPGLLLAMLVLFIREPVRIGGSAPAPRSGAAIAYLLEHRRTFALHFGGFSCLCMLGYSLFAWAPTFLIRTYGMTPSEAGYGYGLVLCLCCPAGVIAGGIAADYLTRRGYSDAALRIGLLGAIGFVPSAALAPLMPNATAALLTLAPAMFFMSFPFGIAPASLQCVVPPTMRGQISAIYLLVLNVIGLGCGPTVVALLTDFVFAQEASLRYSLTTLACFAGPAAALMLYFGARSFRVTAMSIAIENERPTAHAVLPSSGGRMLVKVRQ